jgi:hypothetical protein
MECLRKLLTRYGANVCVAMQARSANAICSDHDSIIRLIRFAHARLPFLPIF